MDMKIVMFVPSTLGFGAWLFIYQLVNEHYQHLNIWLKCRYPYLSNLTYKHSVMEQYILAIICPIDVFALNPKELMLYLMFICSFAIE